MKKFSKLLIIIFLIALNYSVSFSQKTYTINYTGSGLPMGIAVCNTFNTMPPQVVGGFTHFPVSGGATFNGTAVDMQEKLTLPTHIGTAYAIQFPFKKGYVYTIKVNASSTSSDPLSNPALILSLFSALPDPNLTHPTDCGPISEDYYNVAMGSIIGNKYITSAALYTYSTFVADNFYNYLSILAAGGSASAMTDLKITKITIVENIALSISPASSSIICGTTLPQTFTVVNTNNVPGITSYTWNLGSAANGWIYNGSPAPQTIPNATSTLTLTPVCSVPQSNLTATVNVGGNNFTSSAATFSITPPNVSISGSVGICTSGTYNVTGLPCNATVAWSVSPSTVAQLSTTTDPNATVLTRTATGNVVLTATVTSCGTPQNVTQSVHVGSYTSADYPITGNNGSSNFCYNQNITLGISGPGSNYTWAWPTGWIYNYGQGTGTIVLKTPTSGATTGTISVSFDEPCGTLITSNKFLTYSASQCSVSVPYNLSPNPASSYVNIQSTGSPLPNIAAVQITDINGNIYINNQYQGTTTGVQIGITQLPNGTKIAKIYNGTQWYSIQFVVQH